jgi:transcription elongation factor Elf1
MKVHTHILECPICGHRDTVKTTILQKPFSSGFGDAEGIEVKAESTTSCGVCKGTFAYRLELRPVALTARLDWKEPVTTPITTKVSP